jgi:hypothetical protein
MSKEQGSKISLQAKVDPGQATVITKLPSVFKYLQSSMFENLTEVSTTI